MKLFFCLILSVFLTLTARAQSPSQSHSQLQNLVSEYDAIYAFSKSVAHHLVHQPVNNDGLLNKVVYHESIGTNTNEFRAVNIPALDSSADFGLKWVSDATYNFRPGIGENEDVFFRSRVATGLDWVILGEGSMQRRNQERNRFQQQLVTDSLQFNLSSNSLQLHYKHAFIQHVFDLHRLDILEKYRQILQMQAAYHQQMFTAGLNTQAVSINANNQLQSVNDIIGVYKMYLLENVPDHLVREYWTLPFANAALPALSSIPLESLLTQDQMLMNLQNQQLASSQKNADKPSLRAKFRYNYYDNAQQSGRSFASIGASLSVPIRFGKNHQAVAYQIATQENNLYYQRLMLKETLSVQHKSFYMLKNNLFQLQNDLLYVQALLDNETVVQQQHNKNFSPAKYIGYVEMLIQKKLAVLQVSEQLCEAYVTFHMLSGLKNQKDSLSINNQPQHH